MKKLYQVNCMTSAWQVAESGICPSVNDNIRKHFNGHENLKNIIKQNIIKNVLKVHDMGLTYTFN